MAWRTLRRRVRCDGIVDGRPMYRAGNIRMVLTSDRKCFLRVVPCPSCPRLRITARVVTGLDLYAGSFSELCERCVPTSVRPMDLSGLDGVLAGE